MRVLYISAWFPYPQDNGARIRTYHLLKALSKDHEVHLISLLQDDSDPADCRHLERLCRVHSLHRAQWFRSRSVKSALGYFSSVPRSVVDTFDRGIAQAVCEATALINPQVIVASTLGAAVYVPHRCGIPTVLDEHNCEFGILKRAADRETSLVRRYRQVLGWKKARHWEWAVCRQFSAVTIVSEEDYALLLSGAPDLKSISVVPNGVDPVHYSPDARCPAPDILLYNGALTYGANLDAIRHYANDIYPILKRALPNVILQVSGRTDGVDTNGVKDCEGVRLTGYVDDIRPLLRASSVCVVPLRHGGGSRLKILEAMAAGVPVVSSTVGAEGLRVVDGTHLLIADSAADFALAVARILGDHALAQKLAVNARRLVESVYSWHTIGDAFCGIVESAGFCGSDPI